ncbi:MAG: hypothetical protein JXQ90_02125 [Cyclobacteriaceae bacterium]
MNFRLFVIGFVLALTQGVTGQSLNSRIEAEYSIKEVASDGKKGLTLGKVFYDINKSELAHNIRFPEKELLVFRDTLIYSLKHDSIRSVGSPIQMMDFSIYHLILSNNISDFGLGQVGYRMTKVEEEGDKIVTEWRHELIPDASVVITKLEGLIDAIIFYDKDYNILAKQFYKEYQKVGRYVFPHKIYETVYAGEVERKKITEHKNVKIDDFEDEEEFYNAFNVRIKPVLGTTPKN